MIRSPEYFNAVPPAHFDGEFLWDFLAPAWTPTRCELMDLDAALERFGAFLVFETKHDYCRGAFLQIPEGQRIALKQLALIRDGNGRNPFTIIFCAKTRNSINGFDIWHGPHVYSVPGDADRLLQFCAGWFLRPWW
jgi:hypothetical protein